MVQNLQRKSLLVTRLLSRVKPPELNELIDLDDLVAQSKGGATKSASRTKNILNKLLHNESFYVNLLIRYVSLVPTLRHPDQTCVAKDELLVCLDCLQFLSLRVGSQLDHAICLCCYFLYLGKRAFLAMGTSSCHGPVTYVIMYPSNDLAVDANNEARPEVQPLLIDAQTGERYKPNDYYLQLNSIDCIVTETNASVFIFTFHKFNFESNFQTGLCEHTEKQCSESDEFQSTQNKLLAATVRREGGGPICDQQLDPAEHFRLRRADRGGHVGGKD